MTGRILTPEGTPAVHAAVRLEETTRSGRMATWGFAWTGEDGRYRAAALATGSYTITATATDNAWVVEPQTNISLTEGKTTNAADLHAHVGAGVVGTLVDAETGLPVVGLTVRTPVITCLTGDTHNGQSHFDFAYIDRRGHFFLYVAAIDLAAHVKGRPTAICRYRLCAKPCRWRCRKAKPSPSR